MVAITLNQKHFDAAIVDLDGTMVDTLGDFAAALNGMLSELALPPVLPAAVEPMIGKGSEHLIQSCLLHVLRPDGRSDGGQRGAALEDAADAVTRLYPRALASYQRHYLAVNGLHAVVYPGVVQGLQRLQSQGLKLACLTNKPHAFAQALLRRKGLDGFFEQVFGGDSFERKKPDPMPVHKTCEALGTAPARTLVIGDSSNDAKAARAAGCPVVLMTYGYNHGQPVQQVDADGFVSALDELRLEDVSATPTGR